MKYDKNKNVSLLSATITIKSLSERTKFLQSLISPSIKYGDCYNAWRFFARHFLNGRYHIKGIGFDQPYSPVAHAESTRIKFSISAMHRLTTSILDVSNSFQNKKIPIYEIFCVCPPPY